MICIRTKTLKNSVQNLSYYSLPCKHNIETYDGRDRYWISKYWHINFNITSHDDEKYVIFWTELVEFAWFPECKSWMTSFLFTSCYIVMSSLTSILCLYHRTTRSETSTITKCIFCWMVEIFMNRKVLTSFEKFRGYLLLQI